MDLAIAVQDFLIICEEFEFLFCSIYPFFMNCQKEKVFSEALEIFIKTKRITSLPSVELLDMFSTYFFEHGKKDLIEKLLMSINIESLDQKKLSKFC